VAVRRYSAESYRPLTCLLFISPLLIVYEAGILVLGPHSLRNGADVWLRQLLEAMGFGQYLMLPILTCALLLGWHHVRRDRWEVSTGMVTFMWLESWGLAFVLYLLAQMQHGLVAHWSLAAVSSVAPTCALESEVRGEGTIARLIGYCGAGIYEELLFRLMLLPIAFSLFARSRLSRPARLAWAIGITSVIFSLAHYDFITPGGYSFDWYSFTFRFAAGAFFACLFVMRGFGVTAGTHACYDILVELL